MQYSLLASPKQVYKLTLKLFPTWELIILQWNSIDDWY